MPGYEYMKDEQVQTPSGQIATDDFEHWSELLLQVSPWFYWDVQLSLAAASSLQWNYQFAEGACMVRYNWMDDTVGAPFTLVTGAKLSFVTSRLLEDIDFFDPAPFNTEFGLAIGKDYKYQRAWAYIAYGIGNHGHPWFNSYFDWDIRLSERTTLMWRAQARQGFGNQYLDDIDPFPGYANLNYQLINLNGALEYELPTCFTTKFFGAYNLHAQNAPKHFWKVGVQLKIPFSF